MSVFGFISRARVALSRKCWCSISNLYFRFSDIEAGQGSLVFGFPIVSKINHGVIRLGDRVVMCSNSLHTALGVSRPVIIRLLTPGARVEIGDDTGLSGTVICSAKSVLIGKRCLIGSDVKIFDTDFHAVEPEGRRYKAIDCAHSSPVVIEDDVFIGAGTIVLKGARIGCGAVIAAGSVVSGVVPARTVCGGVPAKVLRQI